MRWSVILTKTANKTLCSQLSYIHKKNPNAARRIAMAIALNLQQLTVFPKIGRIGRRKGTRELVISGTPFIAIYRIKGRRVEILRMLHSSQKWPR